MPFMIVAGRAMRYEDAGLASGPAVLFVHSLGTSLALWDDVALAFARAYRLVRYDLPGHGLSEEPDGEATIDGLADDALALLDALGIAKAVVVGLSIGGMIAQALAARVPERISAVVLVNTANRIGPAAAWDERIAMVRAHGVRSMVEGGVKRWFTAAATSDAPATVRGFATMLARTSDSGYAACCAAVRDGDLRASNAAIACPTLIVSGGEDPLTPPAFGEAMHAAIAGSSFAVIENAAHLIAAQRPRELAALIAPFLERIAR